MKPLQAILLSVLVGFFALSRLIADPLPIHQSPRMRSGGILGTKGYEPLQGEEAFRRKVTEKPVSSWENVSMPKPANVSEAEWKKMQAAEEEEKKKSIPADEYQLAKQAGQYVGWFGIVRRIQFDEKSGRSHLLIEHKYFDGLTDIHIQVVSLYGAGDFETTLPQKITEAELRQLDLICVYGRVNPGKSGLPEVAPEFLRVWKWGLFTFMDYGKDKSNPEWVKLRQAEKDDIYSSDPDKEYYEQRLGKR